MITTTTLAAALCLAATLHNEARNQPTTTQRAVIAVILNNADLDNLQTICTTAQNHHKFTSNKPANFSGKALVSSVPTSHQNYLAIGVPKNDAKAYLKALQLAAHALGNPREFAKPYPYHYFNNLRLGKRFKTPVKAKRIGALLFY